MSIAVQGVSHPGKTLRRHLQLAGLTASALSRNLDVPPNRVTGILNGQRGITGDTALRLAHFFQTAPDYWLGLQAEYDLYLASREKGREILALPTINSDIGPTDRRMA